MKTSWTIYLWILLWGVLNPGCASIGKVLYHEPHEITFWDAKKIHPFSHLSDRHKRLSMQQSQLINKIYGEEISHKGDLIAYYEARKRKGIYGDVGNIFLVHAKGEFGPLDILVSTTDRSVDKILVKNNPVLDGKPLIPDEFLQQFIGRSLGDSWEVAQKPLDLVTLPSKIRLIAGYPKMSQEVANSIHKVLVWENVLQIQ